MDEICEKIKKSLEGDYEVFDKDNFEEILDECEYNRKPSKWIY